MRLEKWLGMLAILALAPSAGTAGKDDVAKVFQHFASPETIEESRELFAKEYADIFSDAMRERLVRMLDRARFAEMLPDAVTDPWMREVVARMGRQCVREFSAGEFAEVASDIRLNPAPPSRLDVKTARGRMIMAVTVCRVLIVARLRGEMRDERHTGLKPTLAQLSKILMNDAVVSFPNRVLRQEVMEELRKASP